MRRGRGAASCRRRVDRWRRGRAGRTVPRSPASVICSSSSPIRSSSSPVSRPSLARASRPACALARSVTQRSLLLSRRVRVDDRFAVQVPAFAALRGAQDPGPLGARRAHRGQGVPARDQHLLDVAGVDLGPAQLHRPQAGAVLGGQLLDHVPGQRHGHPLGPRRPRRGHQSPSGRSAVSKGPA